MKCSIQARRRNDVDAPLGPFAVRNPVSGTRNQMTEHSLWRFSRALHRAINERQPADLEALLDEDVDWAIYGPIDMYPFFGSRRGKAAVIDVIRQIADNFRVHRFDREIDHAGGGFGLLDDALFADRARFEQADLLADRPFRPVQGRPADQLPRAGRHLRSGRADRRLSDPSAADGGRSPDCHAELARCVYAPAPHPRLSFAQIGRARWRSRVPGISSAWIARMPRHNFAPSERILGATWNAGGQ